MPITYIDQPMPSRKIGYIPDVTTTRDQIEPNVMGDTDPTGQRLLENAAVAASGYELPKLALSIASIPSGIKSLLADSELPLLKSLGKSTQELGQEYNTQNEAIGVMRRVPPEGGENPRYTPPERIAPTRQPRPVVPAEPVPSNIPARYPSSPGDFMSYANGRLNGPKPIVPQELMDWQVKLQTDLNNGTIPKIDTQTGRITTIYQQATDLLNRTKQEFNSQANPMIEKADLPEGVMPTRQGLDQAFKYSANQEALIRGLKKAGKYATLTALGYYGGVRPVVNALTGGK